MKKWFYLFLVGMNVQATEILLDFHPSTDLVAAHPEWNDYTSRILIPKLNQLTQKLELPFSFKNGNSKNNPLQWRPVDGYPIESRLHSHKEYLNSFYSLYPSEPTIVVGLDLPKGPLQKSNFDSGLSSPHSRVMAMLLFSTPAEVLDFEKNLWNQTYPESKNKFPAWLNLKGIKQSRVDIYHAAVILHELMHVFGMSHVDNPKSLMSGTISLSRYLKGEVPSKDEVTASFIGSLNLDRGLSPLFSGETPDYCEFYKVENFENYTKAITHQNSDNYLDESLLWLFELHTRFFISLRQRHQAALKDINSGIIKFQQCKNLINVVENELKAFVGTIDPDSDLIQRYQDVADRVSMLNLQVKSQAALTKP